MTDLKAGYHGSIKRRKRIASIACFVILALGSLMFLIPFFWMLSTSLKSKSEIFSFPVIWIPSTFHWENYTRALTVLPFGRYFANTFIIALCRIAGQVVATPQPAYAR
jgi:multiple sugar transport system permease protein